MKSEIICVLFFFTVFVNSIPIQEEPVKILENEYLLTEDGYKFNYETSDGQKRSEESVKKTDAEGNPYLTVRGSYSYILDGITYTVSYVGDENGFMATGNHLPGSVTVHESGIVMPQRPVTIKRIHPNALKSLVG